MTFVLRIFMYAMILCFSFSSDLLAQQAEFHPRVSVIEEYNDNIFLTEDDTEDDWITTISPGLNLTYNNRSVRALVDYSMRFRFYADHTNKNDDRFKDVQRGSASLLFFEGRPFTLSLTEVISRESIDQRDSLFSDGDLTDSTTVYRTTISPQYRWHLSSSWSLVTSYDFRHTEFVDAAGDDYLEHAGRLSLQKTLSSNTTLSANATYTVSDSDDDRDDNAQQSYTLGVEQQFGPRTRLSVEGGYTIVDYDNGGDSDSVTATADFEYRITAALTYFLSYSHDFATSINDGLTRTTKVSTGLNYRKDLLGSSLELYWRNIDYERITQEDEYWGVRYDLNYSLSSNLSSSFDMSYEHAVYNPEDTNADHYKLGASLTYTYRRISTSLGYKLKIKESDSDYINNVVTLTAGVKF